MDMRKLVGRNFARLRVAKGFTQERFAEVSGVTQQYVSDLERGLRNPTVVTLYHLAQALGVSHVELVVPDDEAQHETSKPRSGKPEKSRPADPVLRLGGSVRIRLRSPLLGGQFLGEVRLKTVQVVDGALARAATERLKHLSLPGTKQSAQKS